MRAVIQRVKASSVTVNDEPVGKIGKGLLVLLGVAKEDQAADADFLSEKIVNLRIFEDEQGKMNRSLIDIGGEMLVVSQFTLYANCKKGRRPSFTEAAPPEVAEPLVEHFADQLREVGVAKVETGVFRARMLVEIHNDGPVTIILDTDEL